jgi:XTP/dITP diphosphohydrolase
MLKNAENSKCHFPLGKVVFFATGNTNKYTEARNILSQSGMAVGMLKIKGDEIQSENLQDIAQKSALNAYEQSHLPIFVEDAGLFIDELNGFPGPYAAYIYKTIHNKGVLKLMNHYENRRAVFQSVIVFIDEKTPKPLTFYGESIGEIIQSERIEQGKSGFGFDPIFKPHGSIKTFAEMSIEEKNGFSHRAMAIRKFAQWLKQNR